MIFSIQRVRSSGGMVGINCYHYAQERLDSQNTIEYLYHPSELIWRHEMLPQSGNRILSYVDIAAHSGVSWDEINQALAALFALEHLPWAFAPRNSRVAFELDMDAAFLASWQQEIIFLVRHFVEVHP